jgi:hypothetical protein
MTLALLFLVALLGLAPAPALAHGPGGHPADPNLHVGTGYSDCFIQFAPELTQGDFRRFAREFGSVSAFKPSLPAAPLGRGRFTLGIEQLWFRVEEHSGAWNDTFAHPDATHELGSSHAFPMVMLQAGITDRMDVGAYWTRSPLSNYGWLGLDVKLGLLRQDEATPVSVALRGAYTKTLYVHDMDMSALTAEVAASRTFLRLLTPYVYLGSDLVLVRERSDVVDLEREAPVVPHAIGGLELRRWHVALAGEVHVSAINSYKLKLATVF